MNTETPPHTNRTPSKTEAIVALCTLAGAADERQLRAIACACKALARAAVHKGRCRASQSRRCVYRTPKPVADAIIANPPFAPTPAPLSPDAPPCVPAPETNTATETEAANE